MKKIKEIKVQLYGVDSGYCREIWKAKPENGNSSYLCRDSDSGKDWRWLTASDGEPSYRIEDYITLILCDDKWNEGARTGNNKELYPESFPTLLTTFAEQEKIICKQYPIIGYEEFRTWLYSKMPKDIEYLIKINWENRMVTEYKEIEKLYSFVYLNHTYEVIKRKATHTQCYAEWYEYYIGSIEKDIESYWIGDQIIEKNQLPKSN